MALTPEQRAKLQALTSGQQPTPSGQPSVLTADQRARLGATQPASIAPVMTPQKPEGLISRAASFVNRGVEKFANLPGVKQAGQVAGAAIGGTGALIGTGVAAVGTPIVNLAKGKPLSQAFEGIGGQIKRTAGETGRFGFQLGEQAPTLAAMQTLGRFPNAVIGGAQTIEGYNQVKDALARGDTAAAIEGSITTGIGAVGTVLGLRQKGFLVDEGFSTGVKARARGMSVDEFNTRKYEAVMQDVLQPNKSTVKRETKGILAQARKERAGMSVEPQKTTARVLVEEGVVPGTIDEGGTTKFRTADQVVDMDNRVAYANDELEKALALDPNPQFDLEAKKAEAVRSVDDIQNVSATEKKAMKAEIERFFDDEIETRGQFVDGSQYNQIKRGFANAGDYKNLTPGQRHMRQVAESIAKDIEARYADKFNVKEVNRTIGDYIRARNELQALDGSVVKGGGLSRRLAQLAGTVAAGPLSSIPLVDNIIGGYLAGKAQQYAVSPARKLAGLESADISNPGPNVLAAAQEGSQAAAARQAALPRLPAPRSPLPDALGQYTPSRPGLASQAEARANIQGTLMDPTRVRTDEVVQMPGAQRPTVTPQLPPPKGTIPDPLTQYKPSPSRILSQSEARAELGLDRARPDVAIPMAEPKRTVDLPTPKEVTQIRRVEAIMLQQQLDSFRYATPEMEDGYRSFKQLADRSKAALDDVMDAEAFVAKYGKDKARVVIENAVGGGEMTNNELLDAYRIRYRTEQSVKAQIERMKKGQPQILTQEDVALFALAPLGGIQVTYDENGKPQYSFNAEQSVGSLALAGGILAAKKKGVLPRSGKPPKVDLPTQQEMVDVIDYARLKPGFNAKMEYQAAFLAEKYGVQAKTLAEMANKFEDLLVKIKNTKGYPSIRKRNAPNASGATEYRGGHQISADSAPVSSISDVDALVAKHKARNGYITKSDYRDIATFKSMQGNPDMEVRVYRATPVNELNAGDWVTTNKSYADDIRRQNGGKVYTFTVKARDLLYPNNIEELPSLARFSAFQYGPKT